MLAESTLATNPLFQYQLGETVAQLAADVVDVAYTAGVRHGDVHQQSAVTATARCSRRDPALRRQGHTYTKVGAVLTDQEVDLTFL